MSVSIAQGKTARLNYTKNWLTLASLHLLFTAADSYCRLLTQPGLRADFLPLYTEEYYGKLIYIHPWFYWDVVRLCYTPRSLFTGGNP